jgi:hypothetical protein
MEQLRQRYGNGLNLYIIYEKILFIVTQGTSY